MNTCAQSLLDDLLRRKPELVGIRTDLLAAFHILLTRIQAGGKLLLCGNGGSAADADHIAGELLKGFRSMRPLPPEQKTAFEALGADGQRLFAKLQQGIPAIPLHNLTAGLTAFCNDVDPALAYAQMALALGRRGDVLLGLSTSGNAANVCFAAMTARAAGLDVIGMTGASGGRLKPLCDVCICVPGSEPYQVQESHQPVYHTLCAMLESELFS